MNVLLYTVSKRINSTKQPLPSEGANFSCQVKDECSFMNPVLRFSKDIVLGTFSPAAFNYVQIPYWQRFYYINDWTYKNGVWEASCTVDVLGSFKYAIGNTSAYILRAAAASNGDIIDTFYPAKTDVSITAATIADSWYGVAPSGGSYVIGVINNLTGTKIGTLSYYALTISQLSDLMAYLFGSSIFNASNITEIGEGLFKALFNPFQYIVSCMWFPFAPASFGSEPKSVVVGYWDTGVTGTYVVNVAQKTYVTGTIPNHPQITRGDFLNHSPYSRITLYIPPFGTIPINTNFMECGRYLYSPVYVDHVTGVATLRVSLCPSSTNLSETNIVCERNAQIAVPIQISQVMTDYLGSIQNLGSTLTSALSGNIMGAVSGALSVIDAQMPTVSSLGANGSTTETIQPAYIIAEHLLLAEENNTEFGRPLHSTRTISTLSGFIQCGEDDHPFNATRQESEEINRYLKNGFFYE